MSTLKQVYHKMESVSNIANKPHRLLTIPPNFFAITMGLAGLAGAWRLAGNLYHLPAEIGNSLYVIAAAIYVFFTAAFVAKLVLTPKAVLADLMHPVLSPFNALLPISGMLLALGLEPYAYEAAQGVFLFFFTMTVILGGLLTGQWIVAKMNTATFHPGYFMPTVAGGFVAADSAAHFGFSVLGWMTFGIGIICWFILGSIILNRLFFQPSLPVALVPTLAIEVAPAAVAGNAYFTLTGGRIDTFAYALAGYAVLMVLVQIRLIPMYMKTPFAPSFWAFTFSYAAVASNAMRWIHFEHLVDGVLPGSMLLAAITLLTSGITLRSLVALQQGTFLPTPT